MENIKIWVSEMENYKLLDSGKKQKLEEIGGVKIVRAEPRAWWQKSVEGDAFEAFPKVSPWEKVIDVGIGEIKAKIKYKQGSKHIGIFPEQFSQWQWIEKNIKHQVASIKRKKEINVLNLFGYTGIASLVVAQSGAKITHVDASKQSIDWARENQKLSGLEDAPIRWIVDDVVKFLKKEIKRGTKYDAIIMDPPSYGKGPKGEIWKIEERLPDLLKSCREVLSDDPLFVIFNMYSTELSSISVANLLADMMKDFENEDLHHTGKGKIEAGELVIKQENSKRLLPMSIFAIWSSN